MTCTDSIYKINNFTFINSSVFLTDKNIHDFIKTKIPNWVPDTCSMNNHIVISQDSLNNIISIYDLHCIINIACLTKLYGKCDIFSDYNTINLYTVSRIKSINLNSKITNIFNFKVFVYSDINIDNSKPVIKTQLDKSISQQYEYVINYQFDDNFNHIDTKIKSNKLGQTPNTVETNTFGTLGSTPTVNSNTFGVFGFTPTTANNTFGTLGSNTFGSTPNTANNTFGTLGSTPTTGNNTFGTFGSKPTVNSNTFGSIPNITANSFAQKSSILNWK